MCFKHQVMADLIRGKIMDAVLVAAVADDNGPFTSEKLNEGSKSTQQLYACYGSRNRFTIFGCSVSGDGEMELHSAALSS
jgi:hypothetical protein